MRLLYQEIEAESLHGHVWSWCKNGRLNACTNGVSPKHRLKSHFIWIGILHHNSLGKIEMQKYSHGRLIVNPKQLNWLRIKRQWWFSQFTEQYKWNYKLENARRLVASPSCPPRCSLVLSSRRHLVFSPRLSSSSHCCHFSKTTHQPILAVADPLGSSTKLPTPGIILERRNSWARSTWLNTFSADSALYYPSSHPCIFCASNHLQIHPQTSFNQSHWEHPYMEKYTFCFFSFFMGSILRTAVPALAKCRV
jgi:hypothetical protein